MERKRMGYTKTEWSWIMQDWANSAYSLMITTAVFPLFYNSIAEGLGVSPANSTAYLGYSNSLATVVVGLMAPLLGSIADYKGYRQPMFTTATLLGAFSVLAIAFMPIMNSHFTWILLLILYVLSAVGFSSANIFYDASLPDVTLRDRMAKVSSMGYGMGYIGSSLPFIFYILAVLNIESLPVTMDQLTRFGFIFTALWWLVFTIPYWRNVGQRHYIEPEEQPIRQSFNRLKLTLSSIRKNKNVFIFLLAYFFYIDGVGTIIKMATSVGSDLGIDGQALIVILLLVQLVAFPFSIIYGHLASKFGEKPILFLGIGTYIFICVFALFMNQTLHFFILAILVGSAQGGIQSLSRSLFGKLIPEIGHNEYFGIYNIFGKFSSVLGTTLLSLTSQLTGNSLYGVFSIIILFTIGGFLLSKVQVSTSSN